MKGECITDGSDIFSFILTELDAIPSLEYSRYLTHTLFFLLDPGLFNEVVQYVDISSIPSILARIGNEYTTDEQICYDISTIISTISQSILYAMLS